MPTNKKKNKDKKKAGEGSAPTTPSAAATATNEAVAAAASEEEIQPVNTTPDDEKADEKAAMEDLMGLLQQQRARKCADSRVNPEEKKHEFWGTQPVRQFKDEVTNETGPIDAVKTVEEVRQEPYPLPKEFMWVKCDMKDPKEADEIYKLLSDNYVEDDDGMFRFEYSAQFLQWALCAPEYTKDWHLGVRVRNDSGGGRLVAFISGIPATMHVQGDEIKTAEINFLCVHKKLRSKRLAPLLIKEITRRVNLKNIWQAVYTAGVVLPRPVAECRYYHRSLNPKKLIDVGFSHLAPRMTLARTIKLYKLPDEKPANMRPLQEKDLPKVHEMLTAYLKKFQLRPVLSMDETRHWCFPRDGVVYGYCNVDSNDKVTDFCSFYSLPSSILGHDKYNSLNAAYSYWNVAESRPLCDLMHDCLTFAKLEGFDVFNALDIMDNQDFLQKLKFGVGDGYLQYYIFNWKCPRMDAGNIGLVLL